MGEENTLFPAEFNGSIRVESRPDRLTSASGSVALREVLHRLGMSGWFERHLQDHRDADRIKHPLIELLHTSLLLLAQGWRAQDDADFLREDAALRLAVSERRGISPLGVAPEGSVAPEGLASQPTLSRLLRGLSSEHNRGVLRAGLVEMARRRDQGLHGDRARETLTLDIDSIPVEVHGHQEGSAHNGHYKARIYHPLIATAAETGDLLDVRLRPGSVHTADGALSFVTDVLDRVERSLCKVAAVRMDAGFPEEGLMAALEQRATPYVARIKNNKVLNAMAEPYLKRPVGRPPQELRAWHHELRYQAGAWSKPRRAVLVVMERPDDLFLHHFWLITSWTAEQQPAEALLAHYRDRGNAENHFGELMSTLAPALSSAARAKTHYQGAAPVRTYPAGDGFAINEAGFLLYALAYNLLHAVRSVMEKVTGRGWSLKRLRDRVLCVAGRILLHGRRAILVISQIGAPHWQALCKGLRRLPPAPA